MLSQNDDIDQVDVECLIDLFLMQYYDCLTLKLEQIWTQV